MRPEAYNPPMQGLARRTGRHALSQARYGSELYRHFVQLVVALSDRRRSPLLRGAILRQVYFTAVQALPVVGALALVIGGVTIVQTLSFVAGGGRFVGTLMDRVIVQQLAPIITAFLVIGRSGSAITVELGNMCVRGELELLEALGIDPLRYLAVPRLIGVTLAMVCLCVWFAFLAMAGGVVVSSLAVRVPLAAIGDSMTLTGLGFGLFKSGFFGLAISTISTYQGMAVPRSVNAVPVAAQQAVVHSVVAVVLIDAVSTLLYLSRLAA